MILYWTINAIKSLAKDNSNLQYALGIACGLLLGTIPVMTLHWFVILLITVTFRINLAIALFSTLFFSLLSIPVDPTYSRVGLWVLSKNSSLTPVWARLYHAPLVPFTQFNHAIVMGRTLTAFLLFLPCLMIAHVQVVKNRKRLHAYWLSTRIQRNYTHYQRFLS